MSCRVYLPRPHKPNRFFFGASTTAAASAPAVEPAVEESSVDEAGPVAVEFDNESPSFEDVDAVLGGESSRPT